MPHPRSRFGDCAPERGPTGIVAKSVDPTQTAALQPGSGPRYHDPVYQSFVAPCPDRNGYGPNGWSETQVKESDDDRC